MKDGYVPNKEEVLLIKALRRLVDNFPRRTDEWVTCVSCWQPYPGNGDTTFFVNKYINSIGLEETCCICSDCMKKFKRVKRKNQKSSPVKSGGEYLKE